MAQMKQRIVAVGFSPLAGEDIFIVRETVNTTRYLPGQKINREQVQIAIEDGIEVTLKRK